MPNRPVYVSSAHSPISLHFNAPKTLALNMYSRVRTADAYVINLRFLLNLQVKVTWLRFQSILEEWQHQIS